jgi:hypothetical protein
MCGVGLLSTDITDTDVTAALMTPAPLITETLKSPTLMSLKHRETGSTDTDATEAPTMDISPITEALMHSVMVMMPATLAPLTYDSVKYWYTGTTTLIITDSNH